MAPIDTGLIYGGIPLGIIVLIALGVYGKSLAHQPNRYRPGKPWTYAPVWYMPHPQALEDGGDRPALESAPGTAAVGGASGEW